MNRNTIKTFTLLAGLAGLLVVAGQLLGGIGAATIGLAVGLALVGGGHWFSDRIAVRAARAVNGTSGLAFATRVTLVRGHVASALDRSLRAGQQLSPGQ